MTMFYIGSLLLHEFKIFTSILIHIEGKSLFFCSFCVSVFAGIHEVSLLLWMLSFSVTTVMDGFFSTIRFQCWFSFLFPGVFTCFR